MFSYALIQKGVLLLENDFGSALISPCCSHAVNLCCKHLIQSVF